MTFSPTVSFDSCAVSSAERSCQSSESALGSYFAAAYAENPLQYHCGIEYFRS